MALALALYAFTVAVDPFGSRVRPGSAPGPLMDLNQRYIYPQLARSGAFDAAVFGTSTVRLLDPERLATAFGGHAANLGMNAATPWEQTELASLFLRHAPAPRALVFGLDRIWCDPEAPRLTPRSFPPWLYDDDPWNDLPQLLNLRTLEIAARVVLARAGLLRERIRRDGYEVFTPPEARYDLARARLNLRLIADAPVKEGPHHPARSPALDRLDSLLAGLPGTTRLVFLLPPIHVVAQAAPGTPTAEADRACKAQIAEMAERLGATVVDYRRASPLTSEDANYWDAAHYRLPIASRIVDDLATAIRTGRGAPDGIYTIKSGRRG
ncbi:MAG: hypothetical protein JO048_06670 [Methylobacteriaceae bacterium]|nr:hypothetical protein [Methylobacteriaceae bacterium]